MKWLRYGDETILGLAKSAMPYGSKDHKPLFFFRPLRNVMLDCIANEDMSKDFTTQGCDATRGHPKKKLIPLIFCHGISSNRTMHSGLCKDMASHGYIVFALDHEDESCTYVAP